MRGAAWLGEGAVVTRAVLWCRREACDVSGVVVVKAGRGAVQARCGRLAEEECGWVVLADDACWAST